MRKILRLPRDRYPLFAITMIIVLLAPLVLYGYIGIFTRYVADDYETAGALTREGFWGAQRYWYETWSGRVSYFGLVTLVEMIGIRAVPFLTMTCLLLWLAGLVWVLRQFLALLGVKHAGLTSVLGACLILFITLRSLTQIHQILFWQTGLLTYVAYLVFFTYGIGLLLWRLRLSRQRPASFLEILLGFVFAFLIAGLSEISIALQLSVLLFSLGLLLLLPKTPLRKKAAVMLLAALAGSLLSFAIMALAPGNLVRATHFRERAGLFGLLFNSLKYLFVFLGEWIDKQPVLVALNVLLPFILGLLTTPPAFVQKTGQQDERLSGQLLLSILAIFLFLWSCFFVSFFAMSASAPDRALVIPQYELVIFIATWSFLCGRFLVQALEPSAITPRFWKILGAVTLGICLLLGPVYGSARIAGTIETSRNLAAEWDQRDAIIREGVARGEKNVIVWYIRDLNRLGDFSSDPNFLVNRAAADYYHLDTIIALDKE